MQESIQTVVHKWCIHHSVDYSKFHKARVRPYPRLRKRFIYILSKTTYFTVRELVKYFGLSQTYVYTITAGTKDSRATIEEIRMVHNWLIEQGIEVRPWSKLPIEVNFRSVLHSAKMLESEMENFHVLAKSQLPPSEDRVIIAMGHISHIINSIESHVHHGTT